MKDSSVQTAKLTNLKITKEQEEEVDPTGRLPVILISTTVAYHQEYSCYHNVPLAHSMLYVDKVQSRAETVSKK